MNRLLQAPAREKTERDAAVPLEPARGSPASGRPIAAKAPAGIDEHLVSLLAPTSFEAEQYRTLRLAVEQRHRTDGLSVVAVSSPVAGEGKTTTAINLAGALAQASDSRVLLVDLDTRIPSVGGQLGLKAPEEIPGIVEAILNPGLTLASVVRPLPPSRLSFIPAGRPAEAPYEALKSLRLGELVEEARRLYEYVVIDMPPLVAVPDCRIIGRLVDGFLVVVAAHKSPRKLLAEALNLLEPSRVLGLVFNGDERPLSGYYGYYYGYARPAAKKRDDWYARMAKKKPPRSAKAPNAAARPRQEEPWR